MGVVTSAVSPLDLPIRARAIGLEIEILPSRTSASRSPTILYLTFSSVSSSTSVTVAPNLIVVPRQLGRVNDLGAPDLVLELGHARLVEALGFLGGVVLGVLRQVAMRTGFRDGLDDAGTLLGLQALQFRLEDA